MGLTRFLRPGWFDQVRETALKKAATAVLVGCGGKMGETGEKVGLPLLKR